MLVSNSRLKEKIKFFTAISNRSFLGRHGEGTRLTAEFFWSANFLGTLALLLWPVLYCNPPTCTVIGSNPVVVEMCVSLTFMELGTQK